MKHNYKAILANLNAILLIVGFQLFTSIVFNSDFESDRTRAYSVIYRLFALIIALLTIIAHGIRRSKSLDAGMIAFWGLWILYTCRILYDLFLREESYLISEANKLFLCLFIFGGVLIPTIAFFLSRASLDFEKIFKCIFFLLLFVIWKGISNNIVSHQTGRASLNAAGSTLMFGTFGSILALLSLTIITNKMKFRKIAWIAFVLGLYAVGIAASRGPFVALMIVLLCYLSKLKISQLMGVVIPIIVLLCFSGNEIISLLNTNFPTLMGRMILTVDELDIGDRSLIFEQAIEQFIANPFWGDWFLLDHNDVTSSPHNAIIEAFSSLGILGGMLIFVLYITLLINAFKILKSNSYLSFYASLCLLLIFYSITTGGSVIMKPDFNFAFLSILIINTKVFNKYGHEK